MLSPQKHGIDEAVAITSQGVLVQLLSLTSDRRWQAYLYTAHVKLLQYGQRVASLIVCEEDRRPVRAVFT